MLCQLTSFYLKNLRGALNKACFSDPKQRGEAPFFPNAFDNELALTPLLRTGILKLTAQAYISFHCLLKIMLYLCSYLKVIK